MLRFIIYCCLGLSLPLQGQSNQPDPYDLLNQADSLRMLAAFDSAKPIFKEAAQIFIEKEDWIGKMRVDISLSRMDLVEENWSEAKSRIDQLVELAKEKKIEGQELASCYNILAAIAGEWANNFSEALVYHQMAKHQLEGLDSRKARITLARTNASIGLCHFNLGDFKTAQNFYQRALGSFIIIEGNETPNVAIAYAKLGEVAFEQLDYLSAIEHLKKALDLQRALLPPIHPLHLTRNRQLADAYFASGKLSNAHDHYRLALDMSTKIFGRQSAETGKIEQKLGQLEEVRSSYLKAEQYYQAAYQKIAAVFGDEKILTVEILQDLANVKAKNGHVAKAKAIQENVVRLQQKLRPNHPASIAAKIQLAKYLSDLDQFEKSEHLFELIENKLMTHFSAEHPLLALANYRLGELYWKKGEFTAAEIALKLAGDICHKRNLTAWDGYLNGSGLLSLDILRLRINIYSQEPCRINELHEVIREGLSLINHYLTSFSTRANRKFWLETIYPFYEESLQSLYKCQSTSIIPESAHLALQISQNSKANLLKLHLNHEESLVRGGIPDSLYILEHTLKRDIALYENLLINHPTAEEEERVDPWQKSLAKSRQDYNELINHLDKEYPVYYQLKYTSPSFDLSRIQTKFISNNSVLFEFFFSDEFIHVFRISAVNVKWYLIAKDDQFDSATEGLLKQLRNKEGKIEEFENHAQHLYQSLLAPGLSTGDKRVDHIIIIPDGILHYLPFEILIEKKSNASYWQELPYLLKSYSWQYCLSLNDLDRSQIVKKERDNIYCGFAPNYSVNVVGKEEIRQNFGPLFGAKEEVQAGHEIWGGVIYLDSMATVSKFKTKANKANILHLAMHTQINDQHPVQSQLIFARNSRDDEQILHLYELFDMQLDNQIALLSACRTGDGPILNGEGLISISNAFAYAGVPTTGMNLWMATDRVNSQIMPRFLSELKTGHKMSSAMKSAKIAYLNTAEGAGAHPHYWAGIVLHGQDSFVAKKGWSYWWLLLGVSILSLLGILIYKRNWQFH